MKFVSIMMLISITCSLVGFAQDTDTINQLDENGLKQGYWIKHYPNGNKMYEGFFEDNKPVNKMRRYYEDGSLKAVLEFEKGSKTAYAELYYEDDKIAAKGDYINGKKNGVWKYYSFYDEQLKVEENYVDDVRQGEARYFYPNGVISEVVHYKDGVRHGSWIQFYDNRKKKIESQYVNGELHGKYTVYFPTGVPEVIGWYEHDKMHGVWQYYGEKGNLKNEIQYTHGIPDNPEKLTEEEQEFFDKIEKNKGRFDDPTINDLMMPKGR